MAASWNRQRFVQHRFRWAACLSVDAAFDRSAVLHHLGRRLKDFVAALIVMVSLPWTLGHFLCLAFQLGCHRWVVGDSDLDRDFDQFTLDRLGLGYPFGSWCLRQCLCHHQYLFRRQYLFRLRCLCRHLIRF